MIKIAKNEYHKIYSTYLTNKFYFPLIAGVLLHKQNGVVYVDDVQAPTQAYVEHAFGFAQIFGQPIIHFEEKLEHYLLINKTFNPDKIRLYGTYLPQFLTLPQYESIRAYRQRFVIDPSSCMSLNSELQMHSSIKQVDEQNIELIDQTFKIVTRFWRNSTEFIQNANAIVIYYKGEPVSLCYSASEADNRAEIDVLTLPPFRNLGLAKLAVTYFIKRCFALSISPLWDCFTNNSGSMMLCQSVGFTALNDPYPFLTINK